MLEGPDGIQGSEKKAVSGHVLWTVYADDWHFVQTRIWEDLAKVPKDAMATTAGHHKVKIKSSQHGDLGAIEAKLS